MAGHALALMDDASTVPALREIADANKSWESRVNALWGLCKHGDQRALAESLAFLKDDKQSDQARAALGANLMLLTDPELMPIIDETMKRYGGHRADRHPGRELLQERRHPRGPQPPGGDGR